MLTLNTTKSTDLEVINETLRLLDGFFFFFHFHQNDHFNPTPANFGPWSMAHPDTPRRGTRSTPNRKSTKTQTRNQHQPLRQRKARSPAPKASPRRMRGSRSPKSNRSAKSGRIQKQQQSPNHVGSNRRSPSQLSSCYHIDPEQAQKSILAWRAAVPSSSSNSVCSLESPKVNRQKRRTQCNDSTQLTDGNEAAKTGEADESSAKLRAYMQFKWTMLLRYGG